MLMNILIEEVERMHIKTQVKTYILLKIELKINRIHN